jgi:hypothetical protein
MKFEGHVAHEEKMENAYKILNLNTWSEETTWGTQV